MSVRLVRGVHSYLFQDYEKNIFDIYCSLLYGTTSLG